MTKELKEKIEPTAFHKWLFKVTEGNPVSLANELVNQVINCRNPQAFELLELTGDKSYTAETFVKAAKILCDILGEYSPIYYIPKDQSNEKR